MQSVKFVRQPGFLLTLLILCSLISGCQMPTGPGPASTPQPTGLTEGIIPPAALTEVAATVLARFRPSPTIETVEQQAAAPTSTPLPTEATGPLGTQAAPAPTETAVVDVWPTVIPTQPAQPPPPESTPVNFPTPILPATEPLLLTPVLTEPSGPTFAPTVFTPQITVNAPAVLPPGYSAEDGTGITIVGVNLLSCGPTSVANFLIWNRSGFTLQSLAIEIADLTAGSPITTRFASNAPFMFDDRTCAPGGFGYLESGYQIFTGAILNSNILSGHTLNASMLFCSRDNLNGRCFSKTVQFVVP